MKLNSRHNYIVILVLIVVVMTMFTSCSTTRRLGEDEQLYIGVKKYNVEKAEGVQIPEGLDAQMKDIINVPPNASLISPYVRHPFPIGLWIYNNWNVNDSSSRAKKWFYNRLVSKPVLISTVNPEMRVKALNTVLENNGYFGSEANFELLPDKKDPKKVKINYNVKINEPYTISNVRFIEGTEKITLIIDSLASVHPYLREGNVFCLDSLQSVRTSISDYLRNRGYYYFRPEHIEYLADSTLENHKIALRMEYAKNAPDACKRLYTVRKITTRIYRITGDGTPDTLQTDRGTVIVMRPARLRTSLIPSCIAMREGRRITLRNVANTESYLARIGVFRNISVDVTPLDSIKEGQTWVDADISCTFDAPMEAKIELNASYKTNGYLGPGVVASISHNNIFGGGEKLSLELNANYEWQIGAKGGTAKGGSNYYDFGVTASLSFPRLLAPKFISTSRRELSWTKLALSAKLLNSPGGLKFLRSSLGLTYQWSNRRRILSHEVMLPEISFSRRLSEPTKIEESESRVYNSSQRNELVPQISYTLTFSKKFGAHRQHSIVWRSTIAEAGNITSGLFSLFGYRNPAKFLLGVRFSQYVKLSTQIAYDWRIVGNHHFVARIMTGAGILGNNSFYMPFGEDFYAGGPNLIRGFAMRSLGPGSYDGLTTDQYEHRGSFQFIANAEYRFPILGWLNGAVFVDAGNIWLLKDPYELFPGGLLKKETFLRDLALSTGVGLRIDLNMLVLRADLGFALHAPYATGKSGYFNIPKFTDSIVLNLAIGYPF